jgi:hypothetical protein
VQADEKPGDIELSVSGKGLQTSKLKLKAE